MDKIMSIIHHDDFNNCNSDHLLFSTVFKKQYGKRKFESNIRFKNTQNIHVHVHRGGEESRGGKPPWRQIFEPHPLDLYGNY